MPVTTDTSAAAGPTKADPAQNAFDITPSDTTDNEFSQGITRAIWVGVGGNLRVKMLGGNTVTFVGVLAGTLLPIRARQVLATSTTATSLVGLY